jgi:histidinol-phosphate aminotransferase
MGETWSALALATDGVQGLQPYEPGKPLAELYREYGIRDAVKLASNENPLGAGAKARAAAVVALEEPARYPDGNGYELKQSLGERHGVPTPMITLGNGSNDVLELIARVFLSPQRNAVFSQHAFAVYPLVTQAVGAQARVAQALDPGSTAPYGHDLDAMARLVDSATGVVFIANPNNPTGTWVDFSALHRFLVQTPRSAIVVVDEAYFEYVEEADYPNSMVWLNEFPNLVVTRTFSKAYGLAALRVGYSVSQPEVADLLNRVRQPFNVNAVAQAAASAALGDEAHIQASVSLNRAGMQLWRRALDERGIEYIPSVGNFISVDVARPAKAVYEALLKEGVITRPVGGYGLPRHLRITIGTPSENERAIAALDKVLA